MPGPSLAGKTSKRRSKSRTPAPRQFNERLVLQAIRLNGALPKADIARLTGLSAQTVQLVIARLAAAGLVVKLAPLRGRIGQPSVPMALRADGAFSIGINIGRRRMDMLLVDFTGRVRQRLALDYPFPDPDTLFADIESRLRTLSAGLPPRLRSRLNGIGIAAPLSLGGWRTLLGTSPRQAAKWAAVDIRERVAAMTDLPVEMAKDTAAACVAELVAGHGRGIRSFLYIFFDTFIGGGLVIDGHLRAGLHGNAGAVGSLTAGLPGPGRAAPPGQLIGVASLLTLEARFARHGLDAAAIADARCLEAPWRKHTESWLRAAGPALALTVNSAACLLDLEGVVIDGSFGRELQQAVLRQVDASLDDCNWEGVARPLLLAGTIGPDACAIGGALLPLYAQFAPGRDLFLKPVAAA